MEGPARWAPREAGDQSKRYGTGLNPQSRKASAPKSQQPRTPSVDDLVALARPHGVVTLLRRQQPVALVLPLGTEQTMTAALAGWWAGEASACLDVDKARRADGRGPRPSMVPS